VLLPHLGNVLVEGVYREANGVVLEVRAAGATVSCPGCGTASSRVHGRYQRSLADLAVGGQPVAGVEVVKIPPRAPRANAYAERWVRTVRSECLDWTLIWNDRQLYRVLTEYLRHYNTVRPHRSLDLWPPRPASRLRLVEPGTAEMSVQGVDVLGGLIHEYRPAA